MQTLTSEQWYLERFAIELEFFITKYYTPDGCSKSQFI